MTGWAGPGWGGWVNRQTASGQWKTPRYRQLPYLRQRRLWCLLHVQFRGLELVFALPEELDQFLEVMSQKLLPSGNRLISGLPYGRPNRHWLSRLPKKAKSWKIRSALGDYLSASPDVEAFRHFYRSFSPEQERRGFHRSFYEAINARQTDRKIKS